MCKLAVSYTGGDFDSENKPKKHNCFIFTEGKLLIEVGVKPTAKHSQILPLHA